MCHVNHVTQFCVKTRLLLWKSGEKNGEQPPYFDTRATREFDFFDYSQAPLNSITIPSLLFGESAEIIAQGTKNFLFIKDLIQSTKISFFNLSLSKEEEQEKSFFWCLTFFSSFLSLLTRSNEWKFNDFEFDFLGHPRTGFGNFLTSTRALKNHKFFRYNWNSTGKRRSTSFSIDVEDFWKFYDRKSTIEVE